MEKSNKLVVFSLIMTIALPVLVALFSRNFIPTTPAVLIFLGTAYIGQVVVNLKMLPLSYKEVSETFS